MMEASHKKIKQENAIRSNSTDLQKLIYECAEEYADCDKTSKKMNERRAEIRQKILDKGIPTDAFLHEYQYYKKKRYDQDGYDDGRSICHEALNKAKNGELFGWMEKPVDPAKPKAADKNAQKPPKAASGKPAGGAAKPKAGVSGEVLTKTIKDVVNVDKEGEGDIVH